MKKPLSLRLIAAGLRGLVPHLLLEKNQHHHQREGNRHSKYQYLHFQLRSRNLHLPERKKSRHLGVRHDELKIRHSERSEEPLYFARRSKNRLMAEIYPTAILLLGAFFATPFLLHAQSNPLTGPQQLVFTGLLGSSNPSQPYAQFNAVQSDASGNLYLLLDQKDGVRLLKTDPTATTILAQTQLGAAGDIGLAMALDPSGNLYITGITTSGSLQSTSGAAFPSPADTSTNSFIGKFDQNLNEIFLTFAGGSRMAASGIAATSDAVFLTGSIFAATLPVTPPPSFNPPPPAASKMASSNASTPPAPPSSMPPT